VRNKWGPRKWSRGRHHPFGQCGTNISNHFLETLQPGDTSCAQTSETVWPAVGRFPLFAVDPLPVTPASGNHGTVHDLKVVSVAVATMRDALQRTTLGSTGGVGLRGGTWTDTAGATSQVITLNGCLSKVWLPLAERGIYASQRHSWKVRKGCKQSISRPLYRERTINLFFVASYVHPDHSG